MTLKFRTEVSQNSILQRTARFEARREPALWVYLPKKKPFRQHPDRVAKRNYYYCHQEQEKRQFVAEHGLQKLEDVALPVLRRLVAGQFKLSADDRLSFAGYVALAHTRVPTFERFLNFTVELIDAKVMEFLAGNEKALRSVVNKLSEDTGEKIDFEDFKRKLTGGNVVLRQGNRGWSVKRMFENMMMLQSVINDMHWSFLVAPSNDDGFLTSDNPVCLFDPIGGPSGGIGFQSSPAAHFGFPLSRNICLMAQHLRGPQARELDASDVRRVNRGTITRADRQLYAPFGYNPVQQLLDTVIQVKGGPRKVLLRKGKAVVEKALPNGSG